MANKMPILYYFEGRGRSEIIKLCLAAANMRWKDVFLHESSEMDQLKQEKRLLFGQIPLLHIDGLDLVQSCAAARYIARKYGMLEGRNPAETYLIDTLYCGSRDFLSSMMGYKFVDNSQTLTPFSTTTCPKYLPIYENILKDNREYLVAEKLTLADLGLLEVLLIVKELIPNHLTKYPLLSSYIERMIKIPTLNKYLNSNQRQRPNDEKYVAEVKKVLKWD